jgi:hypothetical protein
VLYLDGNGPQVTISVQDTDVTVVSGTHLSLEIKAGLPDPDMLICTSIASGSEYES